MIQEFFKTTLLSKYIKHLLANFALPIYKIIDDNDYMLAGCLYTYRNNILYCTQSGRFTGIRGTVNQTHYLTVQEPLRVNDGQMSITQIENGEYVIKHNNPFAVTDDVVGIPLYTKAKYDVVSSFTPGEFVPGVTQFFNSNTTYYDNDTHRKLGEYLRYIKNMYNVNLMPLYNCFSNKMVNDVLLTADNEVRSSSSRSTKTFLIPIKFNKTYTIAMDSDFPVRLKTVFYNNGLMTDKSNQEYLTAYLKEDIKTMNSIHHTEPITYSITNEQAVDKYGNDTYQMLHNYERYLYLAIQIPYACQSSIAVIEGDYSSNGSTIVTDACALNSDNNTYDNISSMFVSKLSLLDTTDGIQKPFSDRLVEYLLRNTIDTREYFTENVTRVQEESSFKVTIPGVWSDTLRYALYDKYMKLVNRDDIEFEDILGYVDKDIEYALRKGWLR